MRLKRSDIAEHVASAIANHRRKPLRLVNNSEERKADIAENLSFSPKSYSLTLETAINPLVKDPAKAKEFISNSETIEQVVDKVAALMRTEDRLV